ncbi:MAG: hypothetical protein EAZ30_17695 [Betaproteobacteria bacterium]|nr:MAG: hypothetical protein EAZ30_17695 [Betaproteobacteria bacterium]
MSAAPLQATITRCANGQALDAHDVKRVADLLDCASEGAYTAALADLMPFFMKASPEELPELQEKVLQLADRHLLALEMAARLRESGRAQSAPGSA